MRRSWFYTRCFKRWGRLPVGMGRSSCQAMGPSPWQEMEVQHCRSSKARVAGEHVPGVEQVVNAVMLAF